MKIPKIINLERIIKNKTIREWVEALIFAIIVAGIFRTWLYAPYRVPTGSMIHTIEIGDYLFADMHAYGFVIPFTDKKIFKSKVERNDIIVFPSPKGDSKDYIKRALAVEGDEIEIIGETIYINGKPEDKSRVFLDSTRAPVTYNSADKFMVPRKFTVPKGKVWPVGDNRRNSSDGRYWGFIDVNKVRAKGLIISWSHDPTVSLFSGYRFERIGKLLR